MSTIGKNTWVAENATVKGSVAIGEDCSIWFGAVVRSEGTEVVIGDRSNIQDNSVVHTDPGHAVRIGEGVTIGHNATIHGCTIGDNSLVGMEAAVLNGAVIGRDCLIGAGALVPEGMIVPDGSLVVGVPGKVRRALRPEEIEHNKANADHYVEISKRYAAGEFDN